jgi:prepilin-type N-terminal cleavage/methylation domain-containing protein
VSSRPRDKRVSALGIIARSGGRTGGSARRGFTLVEVVVATMLVAFVLGSLAMSMGQLGRAKETSRLRLDAYLRADAAMSAIRRDIASVVRSDDLFWTRLLIRSMVVKSPIGDLDRDDLLVFNTRLRAVYDLDFNGEGMQYETQYRIFENDEGAILRQRRDAVPDDYPLAGGIDTPSVEGIIGLRFEAYDGIEWRDDWDSDELGLPLAVRITLISSGARNGADLYDAPIAVLRTTVTIDRVIPPSDLFRPDEDEEEEEEPEDVTDHAAEEARRQAPAGRSGGGNRGSVGDITAPNDGSGGGGERRRATPGAPQGPGSGAPQNPGRRPPPGGGGSGAGGTGGSGNTAPGGGRPRGGAS